MNADSNLTQAAILNLEGELLGVVKSKFVCTATYTCTDPKGNPLGEVTNTAVFEADNQLEAEKQGRDYFFGRTDIDKECQRKYPQSQGWHRTDPFNFVSCKLQKPTPSVMQPGVDSAIGTSDMPQEIK